MIEEPVINPTIIEEETSQAITEAGSRNHEAKNKGPFTPVLQYKKYSYATAQETKFKTKQDLLNHYLAHRKEPLTQAKKKMGDLIKKFDEKVFFMILRDSTTRSLSLAISDQEKASKICLDMNQLFNPDKIWFHK